MGLEDDDNEAVGTSLVSPDGAALLCVGLNDSNLNDDEFARIEELAKVERQFGRFNGCECILSVESAGRYFMVLVTEIGRSSWSFSVDGRTKKVDHFDNVDVQTVKKFLSIDAGFQVKVN